MPGMLLTYLYIQNAALRLVSEYIAKKLFPDLIVVSCNFSRYSEMSKIVMGVFRRYDPNMCAASVDEGYLKWVFIVVVRQLLFSISIPV